MTVTSLFSSLWSQMPPPASSVPAWEILTSKCGKHLAHPTEWCKDGFIKTTLSGWVGRGFLDSQERVVWRRLAWGSLELWLRTRQPEATLWGGSWQNKYPDLIVFLSSSPSWVSHWLWQGETREQAHTLVHIQRSLWTRVGSEVLSLERETGNRKTVKKTDVCQTSHHPFQPCKRLESSN